MYASMHLARLPACGESTCRRACRGRLAVPLTLPGTRKQAWQATRASCPERGLMWPRAHPRCYRRGFAGTRRTPALPKEVV